MAEVAITIVLADDHPVVRSGLKMPLEAQDDLEVVAEAGDVDATRRSVLGYKPTVLVLDLNSEIADQLYLSVRTVETHRSHIQRKLGVSSRAELVRYALDNDLIDR